MHEQIYLKLDSFYIDELRRRRGRAAPEARPKIAGLGVVEMRPQRIDGMGDRMPRAHALGCLERAPAALLKMVTFFPRTRLRNLTILFSPKLTFSTNSYVGQH